ncbi:MAG TPA: AMP-binding protein [Candidatus Nanopelagicaceae bacterium]|nr:AMP-binding protein [Candidatus Nanopelagicaceae bacterium]
MHTSTSKSYQIDENKRWFQKWWPKSVPYNAEFEEKSLNEMLDAQVEKYPDHNLIWFLDTWVTYKQFQDYVKRLATALVDLGIQKGDVVAIHLPNCIQYIVSYYAITRIGAIATGINPTYQPIEILHQIHIVKPKMLIVLDSLYEPYISPIIGNTDIEIVVYSNLVDLVQMFGTKKVLGKFLKKIPTGKCDCEGAIKFKDLMKTEPRDADINIKIDVKKDGATYIMTGGTTGLPKAAVLTHFNVVSNAEQCKLWLGGEMPDIGNIGILPLFHSFAHTIVMNTSIAIGGWMMLFPSPPSQDELCELIEKLPCSEGLIYAGAEILFIKLAELKHLKRRYPGVMGKLKLCISSAGPLHKHVRDAFVKNTGGRIVEGYGLSEAGPAVSAGNLFGESPVGVIGMPFPGTGWGIFHSDDFSKGPICLGNPDDTNFGVDHTGEICVFGPQIMKGYLDQPEETAETLIEYNGKTWLLTGDIGFMNEDGTIEIRDRKKQLIKFKGFSVFPKEVEELLLKHPDILEVAVSGLPDEKSGELIKAWVSIREDSDLSPHSIKEWAKENMAHYKVPQSIAIIGDLPKNIIGKVQRRALQINDPIWKEKYGE